MIRGIDISNWDGEVTADLTACLKQNGIEHVVVRASLERPDLQAITRRQLQALTAAGIATSIYIWMYASWDPAQTVQSAVQLVDGFPETQFWLDCEETSDVGAPAANVTWIERAVAAIRNQGRIPGIYTGAWWWGPHTANATNFTDVRLWVADYDGVADVGVWAPFGGWPALTGKQYQGSDSGAICGIKVDLDVFADSYRSAASLPSVPTTATSDAGPPAASPPPVAPVVPSPPPAATTYTVQDGDTLSAIAARLGVGIDALLASNPQVTDPNLIYAGQRLTVPTA